MGISKKKKKKKLSWIANITNISWKNLFQNTKVDKVKVNLTRTKRRVLTNSRRDNKLNKESDTIMKLQDKGNRFVTVDKSTDGLKSQQQKIIIQLILTLKKVK